MGKTPKRKYKEREKSKIGVKGISLPNQNWQGPCKYTQTQEPIVEGSGIWRYIRARRTTPHLAPPIRISTPYQRENFDLQQAISITST
ncbi:hypothetical protein TNCV_1781761 [Trichonephila clavipes]|nr:hypothetical protein TNCV_1781761 [Trichonephila clavipes]